METFELKLNTGDIGKIKLGVYKQLWLIYSGMPNPNTFVLSLIYPASYSVPVYYHIDAKEIHIGEYKANISHVSTTSITLIIQS